MGLRRRGALREDKAGVAKRASPPAPLFRPPSALAVAGWGVGTSGRWDPGRARRGNDLDGEATEGDGRSMTRRERVRSPELTAGALRDPGRCRLPELRVHVAPTSGGAGGRRRGRRTEIAPLGNLAAGFLRELGDGPEALCATRRRRCGRGGDNSLRELRDGRRDGERPLEGGAERRGAGGAVPLERLSLARAGE